MTSTTQKIALVLASVGLAITPLTAEIIYDTATIDHWAYTNVQKNAFESNMKKNWRNYLLAANTCETRKFWNPFPDSTVTIGSHRIPEDPNNGTKHYSLPYPDLPAGSVLKINGFKLTYIKKRSGGGSYEAHAMFNAGTNNAGYAGFYQNVNNNWTRVRGTINGSVNGSIDLVSGKHNPLQICSRWRPIAIGNVVAFGLKAQIKAPPLFKMKAPRHLWGVNFLGLKAPKQIDIYIVKKDNPPMRVHTISAKATGTMIRTYTLNLDTPIRLASYNPDDYFFKYVVHWDDGSIKGDGSQRPLTQFDSEIATKLPTILFSEHQFSFFGGTTHHRRGRR